jgi:hypothetical protein
MKYFFTSQKKDCADIPRITGWYGVIDKRRVKKGESMDLNSDYGI